MTLTRSDIYRALADLVLAVHVGFVAFVVLGLLLILWGGYRGWHWIRQPWFRALHLAAIGVVVVQAWLGVVCPLTLLEMNLRARAGDATYDGTFISHWLRKLLFYEAPAWVFVIAYTVFGLAVVASWIAFRPESFRKQRQG